MEPNQISDTVDYTVIKNWAEQRNGKPALLKYKDDTGRAGDMLRIIFPGEYTDSYDLLTWDQFFTIFEENNLKFLFIDEDEKRFYRLANRNNQELK